MEINKKVLRELTKEVKRRLCIGKESYANYIVALKNAVSVEELMKAKQDFMLDLINNLPIIKEDDYFCLLDYDNARDLTCFNCPYAKKHGNCHTPRSDYDVMCELISELRAQVIHKFYKKGEKYE